MGLMTEAQWEYYQPPPSSMTNGSNVDYHRENLRQLKKMQQMARMKKEAEANKPLKAFALTEANKKKFDHVQSKVQEWVVNSGEAASGRDSKNFLRGHQKSGPFVEDNDSAIRVKRLSGLKSAKPSDYGTMSQSCQSIPPLNLEDCEYEEYEDDLRREISLGSLGIGSRFSDISIDERKDRIKNLIQEIYNTCPLNQGNPTRKSLNQSIKRYASMDQVSDVESVVTVVSRPQRSSHPAKLTRHPSYASAVSRAAMLRKYASSPKLTSMTNNGSSANTHHKPISIQNLGPLSSASSMVNLKAKKNSLEEHVNKHMPLRKNQSAPMEEKRKASRASNNGHPDQIIDEDCEDQSTIKNDDEADEVGSLMIRGSDIDYVRANIHCASSIGHTRRKEYEAAKEAAEERKKKKSESMKPPEKYKSGSVPRYLQHRQAAWKAEAERIEREKPDPDCPPGHRKLSEGDRREALGQMKERYKHLVDQANSFPVRNDTIRVRQMKADIEKEMADLEEHIRVYERPKVFVKINE